MLRKLCLLIPFVLLACMAGNAGAAIIHWTGSLSTAWENPNNWDTGLVPGLDDDALIDSGTAGRWPKFMTASTNALPIVLVSVGYSDKSGTLYMDSGTLTCNCGFVGTKVGTKSATATVQMTGGTIKVTGKHNVSGTDICNQGYLQWPRSNAGGSILGTFTMSAGLVESGSMDLPNTDSTGTGIFNLNGGTLYVRPTNEPNIVSPTSTQGGVFIGEPRTRDAARNGKLNIAGGTFLIRGNAMNLIDRYVDVNGVIVPYPAESDNRYIVRDYGQRNDGKTTVTAAHSPTNQAWKPSPIDGDQYAPQSPTLRWSGGTGATSHDVYFGTAASPPFAATVTTTNDPNYAPTANPLTLGQTYYWKIVEQPGGVVGAIWSFVVEGRARGASPENGAFIETAADRSVTLSWTAGTGATSHDVYWGTSTSGWTSTNQTGTTKVINPALGKTYYWRIDELPGPVTGTVWNFTMADYELVENFEQYTTTGPYITDKWSSGGPTTITLGQTTTKDPVHGGAKGMVLDYYLDNTYDEITRDLGSAQDWTKSASDANALSIWMRGLGNNDMLSSMSVTLANGSAQRGASQSVTPSSVVQKEDWVNLNFKLSDFVGGSFTLSSVRYIIIKLDAGATINAGKLYVDDLRLYPPRCVPDKDLVYGGEAAVADITDDCVTNYNDLGIIREDWLKSDSYPVPNGVLTNGPTWGAGKFGNGVVLDGVNDWVDVDDLALGLFSNKTLAMWLKVTAFPINGQSAFVFGTTSNYRVNIKIATDSTGTPTTIYGELGGASSPTPIATTTISSGTWYHVALKVSAPTDADVVSGTLYLNGTSAGSPQNATWSHYYTSLAGACIGSMNNGLQQWSNVTVDDFRIYNSALSDSDIVLLADTSSSTNPTAVPIIKYDFNESSGTSAAQSGSISTVYHPVGYSISPAVDISSAEIYTSESMGSRKVNFKDEAKLAKYWLYTIPNWP